MHVDDAVQLGAQAKLPFELAGLGGCWGPHTRAVWERA